jgi:hypothetical protein
MITRTNLLATAMLLATVISTSATVRYVDANSVSPTPPYTNWATAARVIQTAVDAAAPGDEVVVANGVYPGVGVTNPLALLSVNGPQFTVIDGGGTNQCVYLTNGASLAGFTMTNGWADSGGGIYCESTSATVSNCVLVNNGANEGGGAYGGTLVNCVLTNNQAFGGDGGGAYGSTLTNCTLTGNSAYAQGQAGASGGGTSESILNNCTLTGNSADYDGGGAAFCALNNCVLTANTAGRNGGGAYLGTLNNCTVVGTVQHTVAG